MSDGWFHDGVSATVSDRAARLAARAASAAFGEDVRRLREDAGIARAELARASGVDASFLARIERGTGRPSFETSARLAIALGADLSTRLYPNTGPLVRDRHQAAIAEAVLEVLHPSWARFAEAAVRRPARGWIDLVLHHASQSLLAAVEIQSELRRIEQLLRWSEAKAAALPSWEGWATLPAASISRLLVVRETRATKEVAHAFRHVLRASYPADPEDALAALRSGSAWPGPALLWATRHGDGRYRIVARR